jgi:hypothetical protein
MSSPGALMKMAVDEATERKSGPQQSQDTQSAKMHSEAFEVFTLTSSDSPTYKFTIQRVGDVLHGLILQFDTPYTMLPTDYPFLCIKSISLQISGSKSFTISGFQLLCLICTYSEHKQLRIKQMAKRGIISLEDFIPPLNIVALPYNDFRIIVDMDREKIKNQLLKQHNQQIIKQISNLCDVPFELSRVCQKYMAPIEFKKLSLLHQYVYADNETRNNLAKSDGLFIWPKFYFVERNGSGNISFDNCNNIALQFNVLVENSKMPGTFYTPREVPIEEIDLLIDGLTLQKGGPDLFLIVDKLNHRLPLTPSIAHYTWTIQTLENFKQGKGFIPHSKTISKTKASKFKMNIKLSQHIDQNSKIICWVQYVAHGSYKWGSMAMV